MATRGFEQEAFVFNVSAGALEGGSLLVGTAENSANFAHGVAAAGLGLRELGRASAEFSERSAKALETLSLGLAVGAALWGSAALLREVRHMKDGPPQPPPHHAPPPPPPHHD